MGGQRCATGEKPCVHQSSMGGRLVSNGDLLRVENGDYMTVLASRDSKRRLRNTLQWSAPDAGGIAVGVGIKHGIKCGDSL